MNKLINPFLLYGYVSPEYFCDREEETQEMISALRNGRNITLMSPRRMGKTGLIHHVFHHLQQSNPEVSTFYLDIFHTRSLQDFVELMGSRVIGKLDTPAQKAAGFVSQFFKSARIVLSNDPLSNTPRVSLDFHPEDTKRTLDEIFAYLRQSGRECYVAIDEFQQILEYDDSNVEALLRSYIQFCPNVHFIFSGSKQHLMADIFSSARRPFFQSTQKMTLEPIAQPTYFAFAKEHLASAGKRMEEEVFSYLYQMFDGHTWYIQYVLNCLYPETKTEITTMDVNQAILQILNQEEATFEWEMDRLTDNQLGLLRAIAKEGVVAAINGGDFIQGHHLKGTSSVNKALQYLVDKEIVYKSTTGYLVYNRFFGLWLRR